MGEEGSNIHQLPVKDLAWQMALCAAWTLKVPLSLAEIMDISPFLGDCRFMDGLTDAQETLAQQPGVCD